MCGWHGFSFRAPHGPLARLSPGCAFLAQVRQLERSIALKDLALAEMEHTIQEMEAASYDGIFIWKISDFARKRQDAVAGRSPAIFSPGGESHLWEHAGSDLGWWGGGGGTAVQRTGRAS